MKTSRYLMVSLLIVSGAMAAVPVVEAKTCVPQQSGTLALVCADVDVWANDYAESACGGIVAPPFNCWSIGAQNHASAPGGVVGTAQVYYNGGIAKSDQCDTLLSLDFTCTATAGLYKYIVPGTGSACVAATGSATGIVGGLTATEPPKFAPC